MNSTNLTSLILNESVAEIREYLRSGGMLSVGLNRFGQTPLQTLCNKTRIAHVVFEDFVKAGYSAAGCLLAYCTNEYCVSGRFLEVLYKHDQEAGYECIFWLLYSSDLEKLKILVKLGGSDVLRVFTPQVVESGITMLGGDCVFHYGVLYGNSKTLDLLVSEVPDLVLHANSEGLTCLEIVNHEESEVGYELDGSSLDDNQAYIERVYKLRAGSELLSTGVSEYESFLSAEKVQQLKDVFATRRIV